MTYPLPELNNNARRALLINEARKWVGIGEQGGNNRGQLVEIFLKGQGLGPGYSWCMAFVQWLLVDVQGAEVALTGKSEAPACPKSAGCMDVWNRTKPDFKGLEPRIGAIAIWQHGTTQNGHTGVVVGWKGRLDKKGAIVGYDVTTIEGNTSGKAGDRDGQGIFEKLNTGLTGGDLHLVGYVYPWGKE